MASASSGIKDSGMGIRFQRLYPNQSAIVYRRKNMIKAIMNSRVVANEFFRMCLLIILLTGVIIRVAMAHTTQIVRIVVLDI